MYVKTLYERDIRVIHFEILSQSHITISDFIRCSFHNHHIRASKPVCPCTEGPWFRNFHWRDSSEISRREWFIACRTAMVKAKSIAVLGDLRGYIPPKKRKYPAS